jgi:hypothetical protein
VAYRVKEQTARKSPGNCQSCGKEIQPGERYRKATARNHPKMVRCTDCPSWSRGDLETGKLAPVYSAQETAEKALDALNTGDYETPEQLLEDVKQILADCASEAESAKDDLQEGYDNLPEGLQSSPTGEGIQEKVEMLDEWISGLNDWDPDEDFDGDEMDFSGWAETVVDGARDKVGELEL